MYLKTLGGLALTPSDFSRPKPLLLLAYLAFEGAKEKRHLYELFWPEATDPANSLRVVTKLLRGVDAEVLKSDARTVSTGLESDITALQRAIANQEAEELSTLYQGEFLAGFSLPDWTPELEEWVYSTRDFIAARVRGAFLVAAETKATQGNFVSGATLAQHAYDLGNDLDPEDLERLYGVLLAGDSALSSELRKQAKDYGLELQLTKEEAQARYYTAPLESGAETRDIPNNLPSSKTSFIGRDPELIEVGHILGGAEVRLITLLGPGGIGKTRLSLQLAYGQLQDAHFADGIYFVTLDALSEPEQIPLALAQTLNLKPKDEPLTAVKTAIGKKHMLLVLDNFEQLMDGVLLISELLKSCPNLVILVTSRERLNLEEEFVLTLQGLPIPSEASLNEAEYNNALRLFMLRAKRTRLEFQLTSDNLPAVLDICKLVDGSPLGIELAAVWLRSLTPSDLVREIRNNVETLETPSRNIVERHQSLRAVFEHSWKLLKPKEQTALAKLTVFVGGFSREAAALVTDATIPILTSLIDKSLLKLTPEGRFERHAILYQFAHEKLLADPDLHQEMQLKHLTYFLALAEETEPKLHGPEQEQALELLQTELENLRAALTFAVSAKNVEAGLRLMQALAQFWESRSYLTEGLQAFRNVLALASEDRSSLKAKGLTKAGQLSLDLSHYEEATSYYQQALELAEVQGDKHVTAAALRGLGVIALTQNNLTLTQEYLEASLAVCRDLGDDMMMATALTGLAINFVFQGKRREAQPLFAEVLDIRRKSDDKRKIAIALGNLGENSQELEDHAAAQRCYEESLDISRTLRDAATEAHALHHLASLAAAQGDFSAARPYRLAALTILIEIGAKYYALWCFVDCAYVEQKLGNSEVALKLTGAIEVHLAMMALKFPEYHTKVFTGIIETLTVAFGESEAARLRDEGCKLSLSDMLELVKAQPNIAEDEVLTRVND